MTFKLGRLIFQKPGHLRDEKSLKVLAKVTASIKFFKEIGSKLHLECLKKMTYKTFNQDKIIFKQGCFLS